MADQTGGLEPVKLAGGGQPVRNWMPSQVDGCACVASGALGVALSGGGARALAQLGVLKVLDAGRHPDLIRGRDEWRGGHSGRLRYVR
jgi:hypothetical protein